MKKAIALSSVLLVAFVLLVGCVPAKKAESAAPAAGVASPEAPVATAEAK